MGVIASFGGRFFWRILLLWLAAGAPAALCGETDDWILRGTVVFDGHSGYAIVEHPGDGKQLWRRTGTDVLPGMRLTAVYSDHAIVVRDGVPGRIDFGTRLAAGPPPAGRYRIDPERVPEIAAAVDLIPQQQHGRVVGYYANHIPEELRGEIGLRPGDLVRRVNGIPVDETLDAARLYEMFLTGRLDVEVVRGGRPVELVYQVSGNR